MLNSNPPTNGELKNLKGEVSEAFLCYFEKVEEEHDNQNSIKENKKIIEVVNEFQGVFEEPTPWITPTERK